MRLDAWMHVLRLLTTERLIFAIFLLTISGFVSVYNADVFLHLATGRYITETGSLPYVDVFSFSVDGQPWVMHQWLYQLLIFLLYDSLGMVGLQLLTGLACVLTLYLLKKSADLLTDTSWATWLVMAVVIIIHMQRFIIPRPMLVTMVLFAVFHYTLIAYRSGNNKRLLYWLPPLMVLWVNSHGGFIIGFVLIAYFSTLHVIEVFIRYRRWEFPVLPMAVLLLCIATSIMNPYGYKHLLFPFQLMGEWAVGLTTEWRSPDFTEWQNIAFLLTVIFFGLLAAISRNSERMFAVGLALPFVVAAFSAVRHELLAVLVLAPYLALLLKTAVDDRRSVTMRFKPGISGIRRGGVQKELGNKEYVLNWMVLSVFVFALFLVYPMSREWVSEQERRQYPVDAAHYLQMSEIEGHLFSSMDSSDYILFATYPRIKVFYDVRLEIYGEQLTRDYITMSNAGYGWQELFRKHDVNVVVTKASGRLFAAMSAAAAYNKVYEDGVSAIFLPNDRVLPASHQLKPHGILHQ